MSLRLLIPVSLFPLLWSSLIMAADLTGDPTRPPQSAAANPDTPVGEAVPAASSRLQIIKTPVRAKGKATLLVDGQTVRLGDALGEQRILAASEQEALLSGPDGQSRLMLIPDIQKKPVPPGLRRHKDAP